MIIKTKPEFNTYKQACHISTEILSELKSAVKPGVLPIELDQLAFDLCRKHRVKAAFKGVPNAHSPYPHATCISINDTIVHGIPSSNQKIREGDLIKLDFGIIYQGLFTDQCVTLGVGAVTPQDERLILTARRAVQAAAHLATVGKTTGLLGHTMQTIAEAEGFNVLKNYTGHGIGHSLHESPTVPAYGHILSGQILQKGMVICVEAQVVAGADSTYTASDGWSVKSRDGQNSAMFEYMVMVDKHKPHILTPTLDWDYLV